MKYLLSINNTNTAKACFERLIPRKVPNDKGCNPRCFVLTVERRTMTGKEDCNVSSQEAAKIALEERPGMVVEQMRKFGDTYVIYLQEENAGKDNYLYDR